MIVDYETNANNVRPVLATVLGFTPQPPVPPLGEAPNYFTVSAGLAQPRPFRNPDQTVRAFDAYLATYTPAPSPVFFIMGGPTRDAGPPYAPVMLGVLAFLDRNGFFIEAGDGGDSANGPG